MEALRVVLADGRLIDVARGDAIDFDPGTIPLPAVTKNTAGYPLRPGMDWIDLFVGSEGTLGVVTEARVGLVPAPPAVLAGVVFFAEDAAALDAVDRWRSTVPACWSISTRLARDVARAIPRNPQAARAAILFDQTLESEDDAEWTAGSTAYRQPGAFEEESGSRWPPPIASVSAISAMRCRSW